MDSIKAFVGHSYAREDDDVVRRILGCLDAISRIHPSFSWNSAQRPEARVIGEKVLAGFEGKNLFIGICTKKERVVADDLLIKPWYPHDTLRAKETHFKWKTSDWIIQEIGLAIGRGLDVILLIETEVRPPGELQGNHEHIEFDRRAPTDCFERLTKMISTLRPKSGSSEGPSEANLPVVEDTAEEPLMSGNEDWSEPRDSWGHEQYRLAILHAFILRNEEKARSLVHQFDGSMLGASERDRDRMAAWMEFCRIRADRGGKLGVLRELAAKNPDDQEILDYLGRTYERFKEFDAAADAFKRAAENAADASSRIVLLGKAALSNYRGARNEIDALTLGDKMRQVYEEEKHGEKRVREAERALAEAQDDASVALGAMERLVELDPDDHDTRFALAYKYSSIANHELAAMHYSRIPGTERSGMTWNNLGVAFDRLGLPIKAIAAYRKSEECDETLGMSNIAANLLRTGFLPEARDMLDRAFKIKDHHNNVDKMLSTATENTEDEQKRETEIFESGKATLEFYRGLGRSLTRPIREQIAGQWKGPDCFLDLIQEGRSIVATGSYELKGRGLLSAAYLAGFGGVTGVRDLPERYLIEYKGTVRGRAIFGQITRKRADNSTSATLELLGNVGSTPGLVMWLEDGGNKIHVLERASGNSEYRFYVLERKG